MAGFPNASPGPSSARTRLLVVDDDVELCELLAEFLAGESYAVEVAHDGERGLERALAGEHALVVLDVMLPGLSGLEVLRRLRSRRSTPVLMLTARDEDVDRIVGLEMGADDYLPKPFNPRELAARIRAILRRSEQATAAGEARVIVVGDLTLDPATREVRRGGRVLQLTSVEFEMLAALMRHAGQVVSRATLSQAALGRDHQPLDRSVDLHVSHVRRKLGTAPGGGERIKTVRSSGYLLSGRASESAGGVG